MPLGLWTPEDKGHQQNQKNPRDHVLHPEGFGLLNTVLHLRIQGETTSLHQLRQPACAGQRRILQTLEHLVDILLQRDSLRLDFFHSAHYRSGVEGLDLVREDFCLLDETARFDDILLHRL